jgi:hypothetical protein
VKVFASETRAGAALEALAQATAAFCAQPCCLAHNNRRRDRGALLVDLIVHDRFNRKEASGRGIRTLADRMVANWVNEDRRAGRRVMRPLQECIEAAAPHTAIRCG